MPITHWGNLIHESNSVVIQKSNSFCSAAKLDLRCERIDLLGSRALDAFRGLDYP